MPVDVTVQGADDLARLSRRLKEAGDKDLNRELRKGIQRATKPLKEAAKRSARERLPKRGGLNEWVAKSKFSVRTSSSQRSARVRLVASRGKTDERAINRGRLRHPVFGNRKVWVTQDVTPGWFTKPMVEGLAPVQREVLKVMDDITKKVAHG